ncbi:MAG: diaminopimelate decarboxylase [Terriglobales bacterium]
MRKATSKTSPIILRPPGFAYRRPAAGQPFSLFCEQADLARLADRHGTPLYVYSAETIRASLKAFERAFHAIPHTICYSVKANSTLAILRLVARQGAGFDVVSGGELERVRRANPKSAAGIVFSGVGKAVAEMELALRSGILLFNVESASELHTLAATAKRLRKKASVALRVNPDVSAKTHPYISTGLREHKFGVPIPEACRLYAEAAKHPNLSVAGVSVHIGSQITDLTSFTDALSRVAELVRALRRAGHTIEYVDAGGGLGISYHGAQEPFAEQIAAGASPKFRLGGSSTAVGGPIAAHAPFPDQLAAYARAVIGPLQKLDVHLLLEPGRSIVGPAGVLLTRVLYRKTNGGKRFLIVDAAMNDLLRPSLYSAYHEIVPAKNVWVPQSFSAAKGSPHTSAASAAGATNNATPETELTDVVGPICETGDFFAHDRELPMTQEGDLLAILDTGAYGSVLASNYNTRGRPAEVLVEGAKSRVIRRRETPTDQMRFEI